jgi:hypothetical protein
MEATNNIPSSSGDTDSEQHKSLKNNAIILLLVGIVLVAIIIIICIFAINWSDVFDTAQDTLLLLVVVILALCLGFSFYSAYKKYKDSKLYADDADNTSKIN